MKELPKRKNIRLNNYDYSQCGAYFVTTCTHHKIPLFGDIVNGVMHLNGYGRIAEDEIITANRLRQKDDICGGHGKPCPYDIWQGRFYDHIIRNEDDCLKIAEYITNNPAKWQEDRFYYNSNQ